MALITKNKTFDDVYEQMLARHKQRKLAAVSKIRGSG